MAELSLEEKRARRTLELPQQIDLKKQSVEVEGEKNIRVNPVVEGKPLISVFYDDCTTLHEAFKRGLKVSDNGACLGWRPGPEKPYRWVTYNHVYKRACDFGAGLTIIGCPAGQETFIGIYSQNRIGWTIAEQACNSYSMVVVPLYDTLGPEACTHIINQCDITTVVCDTPKKIELLVNRADDTPSLKRIILMDDFTDEDTKKATEKNIDVLQFREIETLGRNNPQDVQPPSPDHIATVCYTSGTTGLPKGALISHGNIIAVVSGTLASKGEFLLFGPEDVYISYLPLAHIYEKFVQAMLFMHGCKIGFFSGDIKELTNDIQELKPTIFPLVPRLLNRLYDKITAGVAEKKPIIRKLFALALKKKEEELRRGIIRNNGVWDKLLKKPRQSLGGRVRMMTIGAAPVSPKILTFARCIFGCYFIEGYGQTECAGCCTATLMNDTVAGHVGAPLPCFEVKLDDVAEMEYYASNSQGEVCLRGPAVFKGYYKEPEKTADTLDQDGWLHTGDVGQWLPNGTLKVIDRKKHIFKLSQGEYIAPEKIENAYTRSPFVAQTFVYGESLKSTLVGVVVPDPEVLPKWAESKGIKGDMEYLCQNEEIKRTILTSLQNIGKEGGLKSFEQVKDIFLSAEMFTIENELLTPTMKSKRPALKKHFQSQIDTMYEKLT
ncbi:long-chain-fatty-acid--CoA ligase 5-like [Ptychodera flava]|uniref:long-chain-fatty-acid--CoA ligase 5-like n=1 Tax=Ptychodera flava TaxID=63121 RepID=UPI003969D7B9